MKVGVAKEIAPGERRVALIPETADKLRGAKLTVLVERGAGAGASFPDHSYIDAGARIVTTSALYESCDVILRVQRPTPWEAKLFRPGQVVIGLLGPLLDPNAMATLARNKVTAVSMDAIPRMLSRAQGMDALSSQANIAGYKAALIAADSFGRYFPLLTTAAGTAKPANVLILGVGVAGLQAIATARRLGAMVRAYDVRKETKEQVESLGAQFVTLTSVADATGEGGYARALTAEEQAAQQAELNSIIAAHDIVITTGTRPPAADPRNQGCGRGYEARIGAGRYGRQRARGKLRAVQAGQDRHLIEWRGDPRANESGVDDGNRREHLLFAQHLQPAVELRQGRQAGVRF
jgi:NAD(P) transhydrogenase subunit alpha